MNANEIANLVVAKLLTGWQGFLFLILVGCVSLVGTYLGKYLETKGQNLATKEDFRSLQMQMAASTALVEGIRSKINRNDWAIREWAVLRIKKIEEFMTAIVEDDIFLTQLEANCQNAEYRPGVKESQAPSERMEAICLLYLPEISGEVDAYLSCRRQITLRAIIAWYEICRIPAEQRSARWDELTATSDYDGFEQATKALKNATAQLLKAIVFEHQDE